MKEIQKEKQNTIEADVNKGREEKMKKAYYLIVALETMFQRAFEEADYTTGSFIMFVICHFITEHVDEQEAYSMLDDLFMAQRKQI